MALFYKTVKSPCQVFHSSHKTTLMSQRTRWDHRAPVWRLLKSSYNQEKRITKHRVQKGETALKAAGLERRRRIGAQRWCAVKRWVSVNGLLVAVFHPKVTKWFQFWSFTLTSLGLFLSLTKSFPPQWHSLGVPPQTVTGSESKNDDHNRNPVAMVHKTNSPARQSSRSLPAWLFFSTNNTTRVTLR